MPVQPRMIGKAPYYPQLFKFTRKPLLGIRGFFSSVIQAVFNFAFNIDFRKDILVFLTGQDEIETIVQQIKQVKCLLFSV